MKRVKFLLAIFSAVVVMASCVTTRGSSDEDFDEATTRRIGNRVYVDDPYYGTVVLERDPISGRYYDVTYGYRGLTSPYNSWNYYRGNRGYGYNRVYGNSGSYNAEKPSPEQTQRTREEARKKILGN